MTKWILLLLTAAMLPAATPDAKTEKEVMTALEAYRQALLKKDAAALSRVVADDLTYTHSSNLHQDKAALLASLKEPTVYEAIDFKDLKVRIYGNTALVKGDVDFRNNLDGKVTLSKLNVLHVLVKGPQGWQLVARQATRYPDAK
jgi:ketosteroid isomerase-like protein